MSDNWKTQPGVRAVVMNDAGKVLLLRRPDHEEFHPGTWNLPGGAKESDEGFLQGAHRELQEETGLSATRKGKHHRFEFPGGHGHAYLMHSPQGEVRVAKREVSSHRWVDPKALPKKLFPNTKETIDALTKSAFENPYHAYITAIQH